MVTAFRLTISVQIYYKVSEQNKYSHIFFQNFGDNGLSLEKIGKNRLMKRLCGAKSRVAERVWRGRIGGHRLIKYVVLYI